MRVQIKAASSLTKKEIIEVNSIDEAIKRVQKDKTLVQSFIDNTYSWIDNEEDIYSFIILTDSTQDYDVKLIIYDFYYE